MNLFDEFDFSEFMKIKSLLMFATSALSVVLFKETMNDVLWDSTTDGFFNLLNYDGNIVLCIHF